MSDSNHLLRKDIERKNAVQWLSPAELTSAALRVGLSGAFGEYSDKRELEAGFNPSSHDYHDVENRDQIRPAPEPGAPDPLWVDFVADTGDGFAATYAVAWLLGQKELEVENEGAKETIPRGSLLIHGGDLIYPTATNDEYDDRFIGPYAAALPYTPSHHPHFFAIPGNHDWYDGLTSFIRKFCDGRWMGGRKTPQSRSYFSIRLSEKWWIWGIDIQFDGFIDNPQLEFFSEAGKDLPPDAGVLLVTAKPSWGYVQADDTERPTEVMHNIDFFIDKCLTRRAAVDPDSEQATKEPIANVRMIMAGDIHYYARYADEDRDITYTIAGGGGAYLSLTHHLREQINLLAEEDDSEEDRELKRQVVYPSQTWSVRRRMYVLLAGWRNRSFAALLGAVYLVLAWLSLGSLPNDADKFSEAAKELSERPFGEAFIAVAGAGFISPGNIALFSGLVWFMVKFTRTKNRIAALAVGGLHGLGHIGGLFLTLTLVSRAPTLDNAVLSWLVYIIGIWVVGTIIGSLVFGAYLGLADMLGLHPNDFYAAQRIEHKKNFLRMKITDDNIEVWAIGVDYVPPSKTWVQRSDAGLRRGTPEWREAQELSDLVLDESKLRSGKKFGPHLVDHFKVARVPHAEAKARSSV